MTCKDCLCSDVCIETRDQIQMLAYQSRNDVEKVCHNFKDKTQLVELPCKVGDTVYYITGIYNTLVGSAKIEEIYYNGDEFAYRVYSDNGIYFDAQAKEIYFTREEAEKALERS